MLTLSVKEIDGYDDAYVVVLSCRADATAKSAVSLVRNARAAGDDLVKHVTFEDLTKDCLEFTSTEW
jgi:hypothetical protein